MKLIIDIPEYLYKSLLEYKKKGGLQITQVENCIINGTPIPDNATNVLDAIKLEIKQECDNQGDWSFNDGLAFTLEIIDKYKAESEDKNASNEMP